MRAPQCSLESGDFFNSTKEIMLVDDEDYTEDSQADIDAHSEDHPGVDLMLATSSTLGMEPEYERPAGIEAETIAANDEADRRLE